MWHQYIFITDLMICDFIVHVYLNYYLVVSELRNKFLDTILLQHYSTCRINEKDKIYKNYGTQST